MLNKIEKLKRPKLTQGTTTKIATGCGNLYVTVSKSNENIIEIFMVLGKVGGCSRAQGEALSRSISLGLKYGIPLEEYIDELKEIRCQIPIWEDGEQILSCADAIAKVARRRYREEEDSLS